ncbi:MAG: type II secretion system protein GspM [Parvularculaceae bacterium]
MTGWWHDLSARERLMVMIAGGLAAVLFLSLAVIRPLGDWREDARAKARSARDGYELTAAAAAVSGGAPGADADVELRDALLSTAAASGFELVRIGSETDGQIEIQLAPVDGDAFFAWIAQLQSRYGVHVAFADLSRDSAGQLKAQVLVFEKR